MTLHDNKFSGARHQSDDLDYREIAELVGRQSLDIHAGTGFDAAMREFPHVAYLDPHGVIRLGWRVGEDGDSVRIRQDELTVFSIPKSAVFDDADDDAGPIITPGRLDVEVLHISADGGTAALAYNASRGVPGRHDVEALLGPVGDIEEAAEGRLRVHAQVSGTGPLGTFTQRSVGEVSAALVQEVANGNTEAVNLANKAIGRYFETAGPAASHLQSVGYRDLLSAALALGPKLPEWPRISQIALKHINITQPVVPTSNTPMPQGPTVPGFESNRAAGAKAPEVRVESPPMVSHPDHDPHADAEVFGRDGYPTTEEVSRRVKIEGPVQFGHELEWTCEWEAGLFIDSVKDSLVRNALIAQVQRWLGRSMRKGPHGVTVGSLEVRDLDMKARKALVVGFTDIRVRAPSGGRE